jgi:hypothetical protein
VPFHLASIHERTVKIRTVLQETRKENLKKERKRLIFGQFRKLLSLRDQLVITDRISRGLIWWCRIGDGVRWDFGWGLYEISGSFFKGGNVYVHGMCNGDVCLGLMIPFRSCLLMNVFGTFIRISCLFGVI